MKYPAFLVLLIAFLFGADSNLLLSQNQENLAPVSSLKKPAIKQAKPIIHKKELVPAPSAQMQPMHLNPANKSVQTQYIGAQIKTKSPVSDLDYWDDYIRKAEKKVAELDPQDQQAERIKLKLEAAIEKAKIRKALIMLGQ